MKQTGLDFVRNLEMSRCSGAGCQFHLTSIVDALLFRFGLVLGTLADQTQNYSPQLDVLFGLLVL
jgi:hypothetical protein